MQQVLFLLFAIVAGVMLPVQAALNTGIGRAVKDPIYATLISFIVGTIGLLAYMVAARVDWSTFKSAATLPWYYWTGGLLGAVYVAAIVVLTPRFGVALTFGITVAAQMAFGVVMDHYGWLGVPVSPINWPRVLGVAMVIGGVILVRSN